MRTGNVLIGAVKAKENKLKKHALSFEQSQKLSTKKLYNLEKRIINSEEPEIYEGEWINEIHSIMKKNGHFPNYKNWGYSFEDVIG